MIKLKEYSLVQVGNGNTNGQGNKTLRIEMLIHKDTQSMKYSKDKSRVYFVKRSKHRARLAPITDNKCIINLSSHALNEHESSVLSHGMKFCPTPVSVNQLELRTDLDKFYKDEEDNDTYDEKQLMNHPLLKKESLFTPASGKDPF